MWRGGVVFGSAMTHRFTWKPSRPRQRHASGLPQNGHSGYCSCCCFWERLRQRLCHQLSFEDNCCMVLDCLGLSPEDHWRQFPAILTAGEDLPFAWPCQLYNAAARGLQPGPSEGGTRMLEKVVLEQFVEGLHREMARWVGCLRSVSLEAAVILAEDPPGQVGGAGRHSCCHSLIRFSPFPGRLGPRGQLSIEWGSS